MSQNKKTKNIISLVGLMGVGKSSVASNLCTISNYSNIDSDHIITKQENQSINEIFANHGEPYFRNIEEQTIEGIIAKHDNIILSTGGGSFVNNHTAQLLLDKSYVVWLDCDISTIVKRLKDDNSRPLLNGANIEEKLKTLKKDREQSYKQAHLTIDTSTKSTKEIAEMIWSQYLKR